MESFREQHLLSSIPEDDWNKTLDNYEYPKRPCDTNCFDDCPGRITCPMFTAWERRTEKDKEKENKNVT